MKEEAKNDSKVMKANLRVKNTTLILLSEYRFKLLRFDESKQ